jgi:pimeloyl-ACP methyl ester carboxylesterase
LRPLGPGLAIILLGCAADPVADLPDAAAHDTIQRVSPDLGAPDLLAPDVELAPDGGACSSTEGAGVDVPAGLSDHFKAWLAASGYEVDDFDRSDLSGGSFGGLASDSDCAKREPVIFVHGNADRALGGTYGGWSASLKHFVKQGYRRAELYGTTYGPASPLLMWDYTHSEENVMQVRTFIEAVLAYTGADRVDIIAHSMGVTMTRRAIKGGPGEDISGTFDVGPPLTDRVDTFVGIAGGNLGLSACYMTPAVPACSMTDGFYPGQLFLGEVIGQSTFIKELNETTGYEGAYRYSMWSVADEVVGGACLVWGSNTCKIPGHTAEKVYYVQPYGHYGMRDLTAEVQYQMVDNHSTK